MKINMISFQDSNLIHNAYYCRVTNDFYSFLDSVETIQVKRSVSSSDEILSARNVTDISCQVLIWSVNKRFL